MKNSTCPTDPCRREKKLGLVAKEGQNGLRNEVIVMKLSMIEIIPALLLLTLFALPLRASEESDRDAIRECLAAWGKTPFTATSPYRKLATSVKIAGIGKNISDEEETPKPALVLVKPSVNVFTKATYRLLNPNGWYCFRSNVTVGGKLQITAHCKAHVASAKDGVAIAASNQDMDGVTVFGKTELQRVGCKTN